MVIYRVECSTCGDVKDFAKEKDADVYRCNCKQPLLTIELEDETSVPKVFYKGKELTGKTRVNFSWLTKEANPGIGGLDFEVVHYDKEIKSVRVIGRKTGEFM